MVWSPRYCGGQTFFVRWLSAEPWNAAWPCGVEKRAL